MPHRSIEPPDRANPELLVRWARRYAKSRTLPFLVQWMFIVLMVIAIGFAAFISTAALRIGSPPLFYACIAVIGAMLLALVIFSMTRWGGDHISHITDWLYGSEGYVEYNAKNGSEWRHWWYAAFGGGLVVYHIVGALLISFRRIPLEYLLPFSAVYMVPFLIFMIISQGLGAWAYIWPLLYGLHALLLLLGAPIRFTGPYELLNVVLPVLGYGFVAILVGHAYSRFALSRLKRYARSGFNPADFPLEEDEDEEQERGEGKET